MKGSALIARELAALQRQGSGLPAGDVVHEMRIAVRRLRAALRIVRLQGLEPDAKELQDALGTLRDLQLELAWLHGRDARLAKACEARLRKAERALGAALERWRTRSMPPLLEAGARARVPRRSRVKKIVRKRLRRMEERLEEARARPGPKPLHLARISVKQVRYLIEIGDDLLPKKAVRLVADLKSLQASLGLLHDADVRIALVRQRPLLLREQREERARLAKIVAAQLSRWRKQKVAAHAIARLR